MNALDIGTVSPRSAVYDVPQIFSVTAPSADRCELLISSIYTVPMAYQASSGTFQVVYTFTTRRSANSIRAVCYSASGEKYMGPSFVIPVEEAPMSANDEVDARTWPSAQVVAQSPVLIKTACPGGEEVNHPCRTVYFLDNVGKRHAFPNEKAYFTWYADWRHIHVITESTMAGFPLGKNIVYKPVARLVKFPSTPTVYVVTRKGVLRPIGSEPVAIELYGAQWNKQVDDISEAFYANYTFGEPVQTANQVDLIAERTIGNINENL